MTKKVHRHKSRQIRRKSSQHIEDITQEKFSLQRAESLAAETSSLTESSFAYIWAIESHATCKMDRDIKMDRISGLPENIIDSILSRLKIKEAARTSILSKSWRYKWHSLSKINIVYSDLGRVSSAALVKIIDHILLVHCGSVDKFYLDIKLNKCNDLDKWILYLSRNGIKELIINKSYGELCNIPSRLFSCSELTYLKLNSCIFKQHPVAFKAFRNLTELCFHEVVITHRGLENLINSCPLLSKLTLSRMTNLLNEFPSIRINAPNLVMLEIWDFYCYSQFQYAPLLTSASFGLGDFALANDKNCKIVELLDSMPSLQILEFFDDALKHLAAGDVPVRLPFVCPIRHLNAYINFEDLQELLAVFCIFRSSPFIQFIYFTSRYHYYPRIPADGFWKGEHDFNFRLDHLQEVFVTCFNGTESELKFMEFLLANAPALKEMCIGFPGDVEDVSSTIKKLVRFPRISPSAKLCFV